MPGKCAITFHNCTGVEITVGHRTFSEQFHVLSVQFRPCAYKFEFISNVVFTLLHVIVCYDKGDSKVETFCTSQMEKIRSIHCSFHITVS